MTVAVLGLGGIGGMITARTGALGVGTEQTVEAIRSSGLTLIHGGETTVSRPEVVTRLDRPVSLLVVAVKAYALDDAIERVGGDALTAAVVLPLLNGLEHVGAIRTRLEGVVVAGSIGSIESFSPEPSVVVQRSTTAATISAASDELDSDALGAALEPLRVPGLEVVVVQGERRVLWEKAARLAVLSAGSIASGLPVGGLRTDPAWRPRIQAGLAEACLVAEEDGVELEAASQWAMVESLPENLVPSAARDAAVGRPTELDAITGSVVRAARRLGVWTPMLDGLLADAARRTEELK